MNKPTINKNTLTAFTTKSLKNLQSIVGTSKAKNNNLSKSSFVKVKNKDSTTACSVATLNKSASKIISNKSSENNKHSKEKSNSMIFNYNNLFTVGTQQKAFILSSSNKAGILRNSLKYERNIDLNRESKKFTILYIPSSPQSITSNINKMKRKQMKNKNNTKMQIFKTNKEKALYLLVISNIANTSLKLKILNSCSKLSSVYSINSMINDYSKILIHKYFIYRGLLKSYIKDSVTKKAIKLKFHPSQTTQSLINYLKEEDIQSELCNNVIFSQLLSIILNEDLINLSISKYSLYIINIKLEYKLLTEITVQIDQLTVSSILAYNKIYQENLNSLSTSKSKVEYSQVNLSLKFLFKEIYNYINLQTKDYILISKLRNIINNKIRIKHKLSLIKVFLKYP